MAWAFSIAITINHTKVPNTDLTDFPMLFIGAYSELAGTTYGGAVTNINGYDIIFAADSAGATPRKFERVNYAMPTGAIECWIKIPTLSHTVDTVIYMLYGNPAITTDQQDSANTWSNGYGLVMHYGSPISFSTRDSTG